jgi:hypothetical protein
MTRNQKDRWLIALFCLLALAAYGLSRFPA